jgi:hypothetical protein
MAKRKTVPAPAPVYISEWNPDAGPLPPGYIDDSEDMIAGVTLDTEWDGDIEDAPHDRIYAEVDRRAAEAKAAAASRNK